MHRLNDVHHTVGDFAIPFGPCLFRQYGISESQREIYANEATACILPAQELGKFSTIDETRFANFNISYET